MTLTLYIDWIFTPQVLTMTHIPTYLDNSSLLFRAKCTGPFTNIQLRVFSLGCPAKSQNFFSKNQSSAPCLFREGINKEEGDGH